MDISLPPAHVTMSDWNIVVIVHKGNTIEKFLGYSVNDQHYRISSQIHEYDPEKKRGLTDSGSIYEFIEEPGQLHPKAQVVFDKLNAWEEVDVTLKFAVSQTET
ncbi:hypothetical protein [Methylophaga thiooxydans]|uniref:Uncharacterized protein n=1 Tax=Methylophaga thiooxydans DMS010 TaxID=637616 RepID=C0N450_9GAMM|nr:hypothetical protein [Methylophaga thiooxydans]EEF80547.1 hypothetical protein MDMS009_872 [Methylophaga thiooxydans DMS010]